VHNGVAINEHHEILVVNLGDDYRCYGRCSSGENSGRRDCLPILSFPMGSLRQLFRVKPARLALTLYMGQPLPHIEDKGKHVLVYWHRNTVYNQGPSKEKKFLCIGGPLDGQWKSSTQLSIPHGFSYRAYNKADRNVRGAKIHSQVWIYASLLTAPTYEQKRNH